MRIGLGYDQEMEKNASSMIYAVRPASLLFLAFATSWLLLQSVSLAQEIGIDEARTFDTVTQRFLQEHCVDCHGADLQEGDVRLDRLTFDSTDEATLQIWDQVFSQVQFGEMPPADHPQPPSQERTAFLEQVDTELTATGRGFGLANKQLLPQFGNYVDHTRLFDGSVSDMPYTPARLWRQRPIIYDAIWGSAYGRAPWYSVKIGGTGNHLITRGPHKGKLMATRYFADQKYANPFFEFVHQASGFTDYASIVADQSSLEALLVNAETMAQILTVGQKVRIVTQVKNKGSRTGNNEAMFVGGVTTTTNEYRGRVPVAFQNIVLSDEPVSRKTFDDALEIAFALFLRRTPSEEEYARYWTDVFQKNVELGNKMALQAVLIYVTLTPEFVYRMELGLSEQDEWGRRFLSPQELTYAIHYAFHNKPAFGVDDIETVDVYTKKSEAPIQRTMTTPRPAWAAGHTALANEMKAGRLETRQDVERVVREMLNTRQNGWVTTHNRTYLSTPNPRILQFFREFFGYYKADEVFKDVDEFTRRDGFQQFQQGTASKLVYDTDSLILHLLEKDQNVLEELLTTDKVVSVYWNGQNDDTQIQRGGGEQKYRKTHHVQSYNLDPFEQAYDKAKHPDADVRKNGKVFEVPSEQRCGILTQPSWLIAHSGNFDNDPVRRGKWIREKLLAGVVMDIPINVDAQIPDNEHETLRKRFDVVHATECWRCHKKMNPLGMPFEAYNHVGRWRETELGNPVDTTGSISLTGESDLDRQVADVREMMETLAQSKLVRQSFIRHVFRYWMGRNEMLSDSKTLVAMDRAYVESGGSFKELLVALLTSDSFLYRK